MHQVHSHPSLADRVWQQTIPALRGHRLNRRLLHTGIAALLFLALVTSLWLADAPAEYRWVHYEVSDGKSLTSESPSLAVLVIDSKGTRFEQFAAEDLTKEDLHFDFTFRPVITESSSYFFQ